MASIRKEVVIAARPEVVWDALRDIGALHQGLAPGFVTDVKLEDGARVVTFGNGMVARELIVAIDDQTRRLVWSVVGSPMTHHNASAQVFAEGRGAQPLRVDRRPAAARVRVHGRGHDGAGHGGDEADPGRRGARLSAAPRFPRVTVHTTAAARAG